MIDDNEETPIEQEVTEQPTEAGENGTEPEVLELTEEVEGETDAEPERPKGKSVQERIDEITAARREAEREAEYWRTKALETAKPQEQPTEPSAPDPNDYEGGEYDPAYLDARLEYKLEQRLAVERQTYQTQSAIASLEQGYAERVAKVKEEIPDYDEVVTQSAKAGKWPCPPLVALAAKESPVGPKILHHLATNRDEAIALSNLSPIEQAMAFGRLSAKFENQPVQQPKIATNAPEPAPARTKGGQFAPSGALDDRLSTDDWLKRRNAQLQGK